MWNLCVTTSRMLRQITGKCQFSKFFDAIFGINIKFGVFELSTCFSWSLFVECQGKIRILFLLCSNFTKIEFPIPWSWKPYEYHEKRVEFVKDIEAAWTSESIFNKLNLHVLVNLCFCRAAKKVCVHFVVIVCWSLTLSQFPQRPRTIVSTTSQRVSQLDMFRWYNASGRGIFDLEHICEVIPHFWEWCMIWWEGGRPHISDVIKSLVRCTQMHSCS